MCLAKAAESNVMVVLVVRSTLKLLAAQSKSHRAGIIEGVIEEVVSRTRRAVLDNLIAVGRVSDPKENVAEGVYSCSGRRRGAEGDTRICIAGNIVVDVLNLSRDGAQATLDDSTMTRGIP